MISATDRMNDIRLFADDVIGRYASVDTRPAWIKELNGAMHPGEPYYLFLYMLMLRNASPMKCLEIGTRWGTSVFHMAIPLMQYGGHVTTLDVDPECKPRIDGLAADHGVTNIESILADSTTVRIEGTRIDGMYDLLFIDGDHTLAASYSDYVRFRPLVREGGIIFFDDTRLNPGLIAAWNNIADPKMELPQLHYMGFGVAVKSNSAQPLPLDVVIKNNPV